MASSEWVLGVQIQNFDNPKNVAWRPNIYMYCYCDVVGLPCAPFLTGLDQEKCTDECETYFVIHVHVRDCPYNEMFSVNKLYRLEDYDDPYLLSKA